jgi:hypothetical protein
MTSVLTKLADKLNALEARVIAPVDPMTQMQTMLAMAAQMRAAFGVTQQPQATGLGALTEMLALQKLLREHARELVPDEGEGDSLIGLAKPLLESLLTAQREQAQIAPMVALPTLMQAPPQIAPASASVQLPLPQIAPAPAPYSQPQPQPQPNEGDSVDPLSYAIINIFADDLIKRAEKKSSIPETAALVFEKAPDEILDLLEMESWFEAFVQWKPAAIPYREWFTSVRDAVQKLVDDDAKEFNEKTAA